MATLYSVAETTIRAKRKVKTLDQVGRVRCLFDKYVFDTDVMTPATGDVITFPTLPKGARVVGGWVWCSGLASLTASVGLGTDADYFVAATAMAADGYLLGEDSATPFIKATSFEEITSAQHVTVTNAGAAWEDEDEVCICLFYVID